MFALTLLTAHCGALANPWLAPGDLGVRHDVQLLADAGVIRAPATTWPMSWPDIARSVLNTAPTELHGPAVQDALIRMQRAARREVSQGLARLELDVAGVHEPTPLRTFSDTPREEGELGVSARWFGGRFAANLEAALVGDPQDGQQVRLDGSYGSVVLANLAVSAGVIDRWWGPGWDGSLILSTNARPIPGISIERNYADAFRWRVLRWLGSWNGSVVFGQGEGRDVSVRDTRFFAARVNFRPSLWFEFGVSRSAQWCGEGRPCGAGTFFDLLVGRDNRSESLSIDEEPGNQMGGYDFRLRSPWPTVPAAIYGQAIGEDEAGALPSKFLGLMGLEAWGVTPLGSHRIHIEYADTACSFSRQNPEFDCAYRNPLYPQGYTHRKRSIGHALDSDGRMYSAGILLVRRSGETWSLVARRIELNRAGSVPDNAHTTSPTPDELDNLELQYNRGLTWGTLRLGAGYDSYDGPARDGSKTRGFIRWLQEL